MENCAELAARPLSTLPYHLEMIEYLRLHEKALWAWFGEAKQQDSHTDAVRLELLKSTYRLDQEHHGRLYVAGDEALRKLGLNDALTFYQSQRDNAGLNASVCCLPGEAHVILAGAVLETLSDTELGAMVGHELGHFKLGAVENGRLAIADRVLMAAAGNPRTEPSHVFSAMRHRLYTEVFADRCAWAVCGDLDSAVACLVKITTGLTDVNSAAYLAQADEIFAQGDVVTEGLTHPEAFIRARALARWVRGEADAEQEIRRMIEGPLHLERLDLLGQQRLTALTRRLLNAVLAPRWLRSEPVLAQARLLFPDFAPAASAQADEAFEAELRNSHASIQHYCCCVLLDFASADPELENVPLAWALELSGKWGVRDQMETLANRELRITKKALASLKQESAAILAKAEQS